MKTMQKIMASAMALTMAASAGIGALADDDKIEESGGSATVPVTISSSYTTKTVTKDGETTEVKEYDAPVFRVTVPASLPLTINANGSVTPPSADAFRIINGSAGSVKVTNVEFKSGNTWKFEPYGSNFDEMQVNAHKLGLSLKANNKEVKTGDEEEDLKPNWTIAKGASLGITAAAKASAVSSTVTENNAASVVFTVGWNAAETPEATATPEPTATASPTPTPATISFTVGFDNHAATYEYTAKTGNTWLEWLESDYNTQSEHRVYLATMNGENVLVWDADLANQEINGRGTSIRYYVLPEDCSMSDPISGDTKYELKSNEYFPGHESEPVGPVEPEP